MERRPASLGPGLTSSEIPLSRRLSRATMSHPRREAPGEPMELASRTDFYALQSCRLRSVVRDARAADARPQESEAGDVPFAPPLPRDQLAGQRLRQSHDTGVARPSRRRDDDDLHARLEPRRPMSDEPAGWRVVRRSLGAAASNLPRSARLAAYPDTPRKWRGGPRTWWSHVCGALGVEVRMDMQRLGGTLGYMEPPTSSYAL